MQTSIYSIFNKHLGEFVDDVLILFPDNTDILAAKSGLEFARKANPKMLLQCWVTHFSSKYMDEITKGNISFFINKDYSDDVQNVSDSDTIMKAIEKLRSPIQNMNSEDQQKCMQYIQNLTRLSMMA